MKPRGLTSLFARPAPWLAPDSGETLIAVSTRVRLARNLADIPFPAKAALPQRVAIFERVTAAAGCICLPGQSAPGEWLTAEMPFLSALERRLLVERRLVSRELSRMGAGSGVVVAADESASVMVNEEDHFRIQALRPGFQLEAAFAQADAMDSELGGRLGFAFDPEYGFLTACPSNVGTGLRASVMLHLPALVLSERMEPVVRAARIIRFTVRGFFGEGTEAMGNFFQVSNQATLGEGEPAILARLQRVVRRIMEHELLCRQQLADRNQAFLLDHIGRSYGVLRYAHVLTTKDALNHLSMVLLGRDLGVLPRVRGCKLHDLLVRLQPGHLQRQAPHELDDQARDIERARLLRASLQS